MGSERIVLDVVHEVEKYSPNAIIIVVTNPVDVCCTLIVRHTSFAPSKIIGTGTLIDTARFNKILSLRFNIDPKIIVGHVLGEHGPASFIPWSMVNICGMDIDSFCRLNGFSAVDQDKLMREVIDAGLHILNRKGNTNHGIAAAVIRIVRSIIMDENSLVPAGVYAQDYCGVADTALSLPAVINRSGVSRLINYDFSDAELRKLHQAADVISNMATQAEGVLG